MHKQKYKQNIKRGKKDKKMQKYTPKVALERESYNKIHAYRLNAQRAFW